MVVSIYQNTHLCEVTTPYVAHCPTLAATSKMYDVPKKPFELSVHSAGGTTWLTFLPASTSFGPYALSSCSVSARHLKQKEAWGFCKIWILIGLLLVRPKLRSKAGLKWSLFTWVSISDHPLLLKNWLQKRATLWNSPPFSLKVSLALAPRLLARALPVWAFYKRRSRWV